MILFKHNYELEFNLELIVSNLILKKNKSIFIEGNNTELSIIFNEDKQLFEIFDFNILKYFSYELNSLKHMFNNLYDSHHHHYIVEIDFNK